MPTQNWGPLDFLGASLAGQYGYQTPVGLLANSGALSAGGRFGQFGSGPSTGPNVPLIDQIGQQFGDVGLGDNYQRAIYDLFFGGGGGGPGPTSGAGGFASNGENNWFYDLLNNVAGAVGKQGGNSLGRWIWDILNGGGGGGGGGGGPNSGGGNPSTPTGSTGGGGVIGVLSDILNQVYGGAGGSNSGNPGTGAGGGTQGGNNPIYGDPGMGRGNSPGAGGPTGTNGTDWLNLILGGAGAISSIFGNNSTQYQPVTVGGSMSRKLLKGLNNKQTRAQLNDFLTNRVPLLGSEQNAINFLNDFNPNLDQVAQRAAEARSTLAPIIQQHAAGTFQAALPDITPAEKLAERNYTRLVGPGLANSFSGNLFNTAYDQARQNSATDIATQLANYALGLRENANARSLTAAQYGLDNMASLAGSDVLAPLQVATGALGAGRAGRLAMESVRPGAGPPAGSLLDELAALSNMEISGGGIGNLQTNGLGLSGLLAQMNTSPTTPGSSPGGGTPVMNFNNNSFDLSSFLANAGAGGTKRSFLGSRDNPFSTTGLFLA